MKVDGLILAGGRGTRMGGRDKGLVDWKASPFARHIAAVMRPYVDQLIINCNRNDAAYLALCDQIAPDLEGNYLGPLAGLQAGASKSQADALLVSPCDTPNLPACYGEKMTQLARQYPDRLIVADDGQRLQPLHLVLPRNLGPDIDAYLAAGERKMFRWLESYDFIRCDFSDQGAGFTNINTEAELADLGRA